MGRDGCDTLIDEQAVRLQFDGTGFLPEEKSGPQATENDGTTKCPHSGKRGSGTFVIFSISACFFCRKTYLCENETEKEDT